MSTQNKIWYQDLGFKENPLSIKPSQIHTMVARNLQEITQCIKDGNFCVIHGAYGNGKTSALKHIVKMFRGARKVVYVACAKMDSPLPIDQIIEERLGVVGKLLRIKSKNMILLLDEAEVLTQEDFVNLKQYHAKEFVKSVVLVTHQKEKLRLPSALSVMTKNTTFEFATLTRSDAQTLIDQRLKNQSILTTDVIDAIYSRNKKIRAFLKNCEVVLRHLHKQKRKTAKVSDVDEILTEYKF